MKTRASSVSSGDSRIPLWLKIAWTAWLLLWAPIYFKQYGGQNFLFFCDLGNLFIAAGLWLESRAIFSWQAVALLVFQTFYAIDYLGALLLGKHAIGGTEYMFDPSFSLLVRALGLYHLVVPVLLLWAIYRLGYDPRALKWATLECWIVVPINFFWRASYNVNWARGLGHEQHVIPAWLFLVAYLVAVPLTVHWPTHLALKWWMGRSSRGFERLSF